MRMAPIARAPLDVGGAPAERTTHFRPRADVELALLQPQHGYRFNADSVHLVQFAHTARTVQVVADLGAGCGVIGISLLALGAAKRGLFVEIDEEQAARCARNLLRNRVRGEVLAGDVAQQVAGDDGCGLVVCNPPYFAPDEGRKPGDPRRTQARFGAIASFTHAAARLCGARGRACFVYPAGSALRLFDVLRAAGLEPKRLAWVHSRADAPARLVLVEARRGRPGGMIVEAARIDQL